MKEKRVVRYAMLALLAFVCCAGAMFAGANKVQAKRVVNKAKTLEAGKTYLLDLDGNGKKEKVKYTEQDNMDKHYVRVKIFVNGKKYYQKKMDGISARVIACDLYANKKGMNLMVFSEADSDCFCKAWILSCKKNKTSVVATFKNGDYNMLSIYRIGDVITQTSAEGSFNISADTPFYLNSFGCGTYKIKCKITKGKVKPVVTKTYTNTYDYTYKLKRVMTLYKKASLTSESFEAPIGATMKLLAIMPIQSHNEDDRYNVGFVKVKLIDGTIGWFYASEAEGKTSLDLPYFEELPLWG